MGGFEGGDEGGFWDEDSIASLIKKQDSSKPNPDKKTYILTSNSSYSIKVHSKVNEHYDTISFVPCDYQTFTIEGYNDTPIESNIIYKAFQTLVDFTDDQDIEEFFHTHKVVVTKGIPSSAELEREPSLAAAFLLLTKEVCNLVLNDSELDEIGCAVGTKVPFFIHNFFKH